MRADQRLRATSLTVLVSVLTLVVDTSAAMAQSSQGGYSGGYQDGVYPPPGGYPDNRYPPRDGDPNAYPGDRDRGDRDWNDRGRDDPRRPGDPAPPQGQYAPPPPGAERPGSPYDDRAQRYDYDYGRRYSDWAARYCEVRRSNDAAAGAVIGGILGALIGGGVAGRGDRGAGAVVGGALGAGAGALIGSSSAAPGGCPPGYVLRGGATTFVYEGPAQDVFWAPSWYNPWVWDGGVWIYRPYRAWYFNSGRPYYRPGWRPGYYEYHYRRW